MCRLNNHSGSQSARSWKSDVRKRESRGSIVAHSNHSAETFKFLCFTPCYLILVSCVQCTVMLKGVAEINKVLMRLNVQRCCVC